MPKPSDKICIIGAGPAGLTAAYNLQKKGYKNLTVLEKEDHVSGKCWSIPSDGNQFDMGGMEVGVAYDNVRSLADEFNVPLMKAPPFLLAFLKEKKITGSRFSIFKGFNLIIVFWCFIKFWYYTKIKYRRFIDRPTMTDIPDELLVTADEWFENKNMQAMRPLFHVIITGFGYGTLDKITAAYVIKFVFNGTFVLMAGLGYKQWPRVFKHGYQSLWNAVADSLPDVRLNVNGIRIDRTDEGVTVYSEGNEPEKFDAAIVTCCMDNTLNKLIPDATTPETDFFDPIFYNHYWSILTKSKNFPRPQALMVDYSLEERPDKPWVAVKTYPENNTILFNSYASADDGSDEDLVIKNIHEEMKTWDIEVGDVVGTKLWTYFPQLSLDLLKADHYSKIPTIQGTKNTYYTGACLNFETVYATMVNSKHLTDNYF